MKEILIALFSTGAFTALLNFINTQLNRRKKKDYYEKVLVNIHKVYDLLNTLKRETNADRIVILKREEQNDFFSIFRSKKYNSSVIYEAYDFPLKSVRNKWQKQILDDQYVNMLDELERKGELTIFTNELEEGILKTLYATRGIKKGVLHLLSVEPVFIYMSFNYVEAEKEGLKVEDVKRYCINELRNIFAQFEI